jgi:LPPG:FO 2-phospho-L-lactate transferase
VASLYAPFASTLVVDPVDAEHVPEIEALGMRAIVTPSVMSSPDVARSLAEATIGAVTRH